MWFVHPGIMAITAGLALLPIMIHLINRRRHRIEPWAATMFLLRAHRASRRRILLDHWLLLALRTLLLVALGAALARPFVASPHANWVGAAASQDRVIILDDSLSMRARRDDGLTSFEAARAEAIDLLSAMKERDRAALVTAAMSANAAIDRPVHDASTIRRLLDTLRCTAAGTDLSTALDRADEILARGGGAVGSRSVYVLTDQTAASLPPPVLECRREHIDRIFVVNVGPAARRNLAVHGLRLESPIVGPGIPVRLAYRVTNESDEPANGTRVRISVDGQIVATRPVESLGPKATQEEHAEITLESAGHHVVTAALQTVGKDVLSDDDICRLAVDAAERVPVLLVEGDSAAPAIDQSLFYVRAALTSQSGVDQLAVGGSASGFDCRTIAPGDVESELLTDFRVVVLGDVPRLSPRAWERLSRFVRDGGGLLMLLGERIDADHYNSFAFRAGGAVEVDSIELQNGASIPASDSSQDVSPTPGWLSIADSVELGEDDAGRRLKIMDATHPIVADFQGYDEGGLKTSAFRFLRQIVVSPDAVSGDGGVTAVPIGFSSDGPALVCRGIEQGRLIVLATGLTMKETTLPAMPDFVPFVFSLTAFAAGDDIARLNRFTGEPLLSRPRSITLNESIAVVLPDGTSGAATVEPMADALALKFDRTREPGVYRMKQGDDVELFAVNVREGESDLSMADDRAVKAFFGTNAALLRSVSEPEARVVRAAAGEFSGPAMYLLVVLVLIETFVATNSGPKP